MSLPIDKESLKSKITSGVFVCPDLVTWHAFDKFLRSNFDKDFPHPFGLTGIYGVNDFQKNARLREQLDFALENNFEDEAYAFLLETDLTRWTKSSGKLNPNVTTWWVRNSELETEFWKQQKQKAEEFVDILSGDRDRDWSDIEDMYEAAGVIDQLHNPVQAADLIDKTSHSEKDKHSLAKLYEFYFDQMEHEHGVDSVGMYLMWVIDIHE